MVRAIEFIKAIGMAYKKFEIYIGKGVYKSDGAEDHRRMMETLAVINKGSVKEAQPEKHKNSVFLLRSLDCGLEFYLINSLV